MRLKFGVEVEEWKGIPPLLTLTYSLDLALFSFTSHLLHFSLLLFSFFTFTSCAAETLTSCADISRVLSDNVCSSNDFAIVARVIATSGTQSTDIVVTDDTGVERISLPIGVTSDLPRPGDTIRGFGTVLNKSNAKSYARFHKLETLARHALPAAVPVTASQLLSGHFDDRYVTLEGRVQDAFPDEIDPNFSFLVLAEPDSVYVAIRHKPGESPASELIGCDVTLTGHVDPPRNALTRRQIGRMLGTVSPEGIVIRQRPQQDPFAVPALSDVRLLSPGDFSRCGRRRQTGRVLAAWDGTEALIRTPDKMLTRLSLASGPTPHAGDFIEAVGIPETDLYNLNLTRADWRTASAFDCAEEEPPTSVSARDIKSGDAPFARVHAEYYGRVIRLVGEIRNLPAPENVHGKMLLANGQTFVPVDIEAAGSIRQRLEPGSLVEATGVCVLDLENWRPNAAFPNVRGFTIVTRNADDIRILRQPPFWTPFRLLGLLAALAAGLIGIFVWNMRLRQLAERRGRELAKSAIAQAEADLRTCERTRLAVELHDSVAQNLTGSILEMRLAHALASDDPRVAASHLALAMKIVESTRGELRNCIWDLRNRALEEPDVEAAVRTTLAPHADAELLTVRFNVPRGRISDTTMHAILQILRELTVNAVRHGHAKHVRVAGTVERGRLLFSVRDDGCGFDPAACPGMADGHFGLQGIRERVRNFGGEFTIKSARGHGTRATVSIELATAPGQRATPHSGEANA